MGERMGFPGFSSRSGMEKKKGRSLKTEEKIDNLSEMVKSAVDIFSKANDAAVNLKHLWNIKDDEM